MGDGEAGEGADFWGSADGTLPSPEGNSLNTEVQPQGAWALGSAALTEPPWGGGTVESHFPRYMVASLLACAQGEGGTPVSQTSS